MLKRLLIGASVLLISGSVIAQQRQEPTQNAPQTPQKAQTADIAGGRWAKASDLVGKQVQDVEGAKLGELQNCVADLDTGQMLFATVSGSAVNKNDQLIAVPFTMFELTPKSEHLVLRATKAQLTGAPTFAAGQWPNMADAQYIHQVYAHFHMATPPTRESGKMEPSRGETAGQPAVTGRWAKTTDLIGKAVKDEQNADLGKLNNVVVDMDTGRILFGTLSAEKMDKKDQLVAVPFTMFTLAPDASHLRAATTKAELASAPAFGENTWPNMNDAAYIEKVYAHFGEPNPAQRVARDKNHMRSQEDNPRR